VACSTAIGASGVGSGWPGAMRLSPVLARPGGVIAMTGHRLALRGTFHPPGDDRGSGFHGHVLAIAASGHPRRPAGPGGRSAAAVWSGEPRRRLPGLGHPRPRCARCQGYRHDLPGLIAVTPFAV
jgi:hypothetical protein